MFSILVIQVLTALEKSWNLDPFPNLEKQHWISWEVFEMCKHDETWKNHWILDQLLKEKSSNSEIDIVSTNHIGR